MELDPEKLEKLSSRDKSTDGDNLRRMLLDWLTRADPPPTWKALVCALKTPAVNEMKVALLMEKEQVYSDNKLSTAIRPETGKKKKNFFFKYIKNFKKICWP